MKNCSIFRLVIIVVIPLLTSEIPLNFVFAIKFRMIATKGD